MMGVSKPILIVGIACVLALQVAEYQGWLPDLLAPDSSREARLSTSDLLCGPRSVHIAANLLGIPTTAEQIIDRCQISEQGTSFQELRKAARELGFEATLSRLNWDELEKLDSTAVLFLEPHHFVAVDLREQNKSHRASEIRFFDPDRVAHSISRAELEKRWRGETLVLRPPPRRSSLVWETCWQDVGFLQGEQHEFQFRLWNRGDKPVSLEIQGTSCSCTSAQLTKAKLLPGEDALLLGNIDLTGKRGVFQENVRVSSSDPLQAMSQLWTCGGVLTNSISVPAKHLGEARPGECLTNTFYIHDPGARNLDVASPTDNFTLAHNETSLEIRCDIAVTRVAPESEDIGKLGVTRVEPGDFRITVNLPLPPSCRPGLVSGALSLSTNQPPPLDKVSVQLKGRVIPNVAAFPKAIILAAKKGQDVVRQQLRIETANGITPELNDWDFSVPRPVFHITENRSQSEKHVLLLTLECSAAEITSPADGTLRLRTSQADLEIPVFLRPASTL